MTKDEYGDFVLRYKGCGACFPMYHTLNRFEKMWFTAIQKDVAELEKENAELKKKNEGYEKDNTLLVNQFNQTSAQLTKAKEYIKLLLMNCVGVYESTGKTIAEIQAEAEQFLNSEVEK